MVETAESLDFSTYLRGERRAVEGALELFLNGVDLEDAENVMDALRYGVLTGGKRLRPVLVATAFREAGGRGDPAALYRLSISVELVHAYSLIHDDLPCMDDAPMRRGKPTPHTLFGVGVATRAGAVLIPLATQAALEGARDLGCSDDTAVALAQELLDAAGAGGMVGGQALDLLGEGRRLPEAGLTRIHELKTGALLTACLVLGGMAAGGPGETTEALRRYGRGIGLAFQIMDDILDATSTAAQLGKEPSDEELEKSTYVGLLGVHEARARGRGLVGDAVAALDEVGLRAPRLRALANYVIERER